MAKRRLLNTTAFDTGRFVIYARVSTEEQAKGYSLGAQIDTIHLAIARLNGTVVSVHSEVASGTDDERPVLQQAIADCHTFGARLVVAYVDRWARDVRFALECVDDHLKHIPLMLDLPLVENNAMGRAMLQTALTFAEFQVNQNREKTSIGVRRAIAAGKQCGWAKAPEGARMLAQRSVAAGKSLRATGRILARAGFVAPSGNIYEPNSIKCMLRAAA